MLLHIMTVVLITTYFTITRVKYSNSCTPTLLTTNTTRNTYDHLYPHHPG